MRILILFSIFLVSTCGIIYELVAGTVSSYLLGDTVGQFSKVIGVYLFSMGIGSYLSKFIRSNVVFWFIQIEIFIGVIGGISPLILILFFEYAYYFSPLFYFLLFTTGLLVGLEIPLMMRILKEKTSFDELVADVFTFDYIGALAAALIFPSILIPYLGILKVSALFGMVNIIVAILMIRFFRKQFSFLKYLYFQVGIFAVVLSGIFIFSGSINQFIENIHYEDPVVLSRNSSYQKMVITKNAQDIRLYINHNLQFSSADEYRYHESLVHPAFTFSSTHLKVLILGGGDGMALREVCRYESVKEITLVDLDPEMTRLFSENELLTALNQNSFKDSRVTVINDDAFNYLRNYSATPFDIVIIDFPDPSNYSIGKLYSTSFFNELKHCIHFNSVVCIQSTSPFYAPNSFWCIYNTIQSAGFNAKPYHVHVPSFGEWGFILFSLDEFIVKKEMIANNRFLSMEVWKGLLVFPDDMKFRKTEINQLNNQALVNYFDYEWSSVK